MAHWARVGMQCVCITDVWTCFDNPGVRASISKGDVLTISEVETFEGRLYLGFREEASLVYNADGFRPLVKRTQEQDVAKFAHLLVGEGVPA